jgi:hypothetical protein
VHCCNASHDGTCRRTKLRVGTCMGFCIRRSHGPGSLLKFDAASGRGHSSSPRIFGLATQTVSRSHRLAAARRGVPAGCSPQWRSSSLPRTWVVCALVLCATRLRTRTQHADERTLSLTVRNVTGLGPLAARLALRTSGFPRRTGSRHRVGPPHASFASRWHGRAHARAGLGTLQQRTRRDLRIAA